MFNERENEVALTRIRQNLSGRHLFRAISEERTFLSMLRKSFESIQFGVANQVPFCRKIENQRGGPAFLLQSRP